MALIDLGTLRDYWKKVNDWITATDAVSSPKVTVSTPLPAGTNNIGDVDVLSCALPIGASTEATLLSIKDTSGIKKITDPVKIADKIATAFEQATIPNTVGGTGLTALTYATNTKAYITVEGSDIRFRIDSGIPTATLGHLATIGSLIELGSNSDIANFKGISTTVTNAILNCTYLT